MSHSSILSPADLTLPSRPVPRPSRGDGWNVLADMEVFILAVGRYSDILLSIRDVW